MKNNSGNLITFTVEGTTYQCEEGMTWAEWVNSDYNTKGFSISTDSYICDNYGDYVAVGFDLVEPSDIINRSSYGVIGADQEQ